MLRHFARNIRGSDNFWRSKTEDLKHWITHHVARGNGPPTFFITLSCTENWWPDLKHLLGQLDKHAKNYPRAEAIRNGCKISMANAARRYPLYVNEFFMKRATSFMATVVKKALGIDHYWGRVEFVPRRGAIHLHMICIARDKAYLQAFYKAKTFEKKAEVLDKYAREVLDMTADVNVDDDPQRKPNYASSPLGKRYCECHDQIEDVKRFAEDCMIHQCNNYCLQSNKTNAPRTCQLHFRTESAFGKMDTQGLPCMPRSRIITNKKGISHF